MDVKPVLDAATNLPEAAGWTVASILGSIMGFQKMRKQFSADKIEVDANHAQSDILDMMRKEIDRLAAQNTLLITTVHSLQMEVISLRRENAEIRAHITIPGVFSGQQIGAPAS